MPFIRSATAEQVWRAAEQVGTPDTLKFTLSDGSEITRIDPRADGKPGFVVVFADGEVGFISENGEIDIYGADGMDE